MAVEARRINLFPPQLIPNREILTNPIDASIIHMYNTQTINHSMLPLSAVTITASDTLFSAAPPFPYNPLPNKTATLKSDNSTLSYNNNDNVVSVPRKRSRDSISSCHFPWYHKNNTDTFSFLGEDISLHIHRQQLDLDNLISHHMEKVRVELEEKRKRQARRLMEAIEVGMMKRLKAKEEEILKIEKLNYALEEKVKSLCIENQIWRDLAQTNEATANALRTNLEHVLSQVGADGGEGAGVPPAEEEDAESCCGSNEEGWRTVATGAQDKEGEGTGGVMNNSNGGDERRLCRKCGKEESCVLILPCRHLCLCTVCGSTLHICPVCKSFKNASVHVNMT
ncbi:probable BOI-related E3 ubiquitin-protein ligase 3 [Abrus precatorius]|uniref:RING-type E3 ubiquitin transferase n=1 Tax=Abrus precatorius TaxID=3816 RepID=A0A8B8LLN1_ABRPR|nr:probable BOI-related E3 ubiquitin-protein ligase 3 [Abrus precatorius]